MWNLGVLTDTTLVSSFLLANTMDWKWNYRKRLTHCQRIVSWCLLDFLFCQREHKQNLLFGWKATLSHHLLYVLILIFSCSILRTSCQCQDCCVLYVWCLYQWFQQGHLALFHTGVFKIFFLCLFSLRHQGETRHVLSLVVSGEQWRGKQKVSCGHLTLYILLICAICSSFICLVPSVHWQFIFENLAIVMPSWFKQWY